MRIRKPRPLIETPQKKPDPISYTPEPPIPTQSLPQEWICLARYYELRLKKVTNRVPVMMYIPDKGEVQISSQTVGTEILVRIRLSGLIRGGQITDNV